MNIRRGTSKNASVLVITVVFCGLIGVVLIAYLSMVLGQQKFAHRSQVWNSCIPLCEAGVEEAMAHINYSGTTTNFAINGWVLDAGAYRKERKLNDGTIRMAINLSNPPVITVSGLLHAPIQSNYLTRTVSVKTKFNQRFPYSLLSKGSITMSGNTTEVDSFDSTDPLKSTLGQYDPLKRAANASVVTDSTSVGAINIGNGNIYGKAGTGPGGTLVLSSGGGVGDVLWNTDPLNGGKVQAGTVRSDVNIAIADESTPSPFGSQWPSSGMYNGTNYTYVLAAGDYHVPSVNLSSGDIAVTGKVRILVDGSTSISGSDGMIYLAPGASIEYYSGGDFSIAGKGLVNVGGLAQNFNLYGLSTCKTITYSGSAQFVGTVYAPSSDVKMSGSSKATGAVVGKTISLAGEMSFHYDEALKGNPRGGRYLAASWTEV